VLATVMFSDIVKSSERVSEHGDRAWRDLLDAHDSMVRRQLDRFGGREIKTTGDGFLATFDGPARAIRCALSIRHGASRLDLPVRVGLHTGELEMRDGDVGEGSRSPLSGQSGGVAEVAPCSRSQLRTFSWRVPRELAASNGVPSAYSGTQLRSAPRVSRYSAARR
jgi:hypothetical protein